MNIAAECHLLTSWAAGYFQFRYLQNRTIEP